MRTGFTHYSLRVAFTGELDEKYQYIKTYRFMLILSMLSFSLTRSIVTQSSPASVKPPWIKRSCKAPYQILEALSHHTCASLTVLAPIIQNSFKLLEFTFKSLNGEAHQQTFAPIYDLKRDS